MDHLKHEYCKNFKCNIIVILKTGCVLLMRAIPVYRYCTCTLPSVSSIAVSPLHTNEQPLWCLST